MLEDFLFKEILAAWGWCTGMTQRDGMGKEEGGGFRMGNTNIMFTAKARVSALGIRQNADAVVQNPEVTAATKP